MRESGEEIHGRFAVGRHDFGHVIANERGAVDEGFFIGMKGVEGARLMIGAPIEAIKAQASGKCEDESEYEEGVPRHFFSDKEFTSLSF